jgi:hypothetical protein
MQAISLHTLLDKIIINMNKNKLLKYSLPALALALLIGAGSAEAFGGGMNKNATPEQVATMHTQMFAEQAKLIGATVDEVKTAWANGTSFKELAKQKGITEDVLKAKMKAAHQAEMKARLQTLVDKGVITQAQADTRIATMQKMSDKVKGKKGKGGMGHGMGFGF